MTRGRRLDWSGSDEFGELGGLSCCKPTSFPVGDVPVMCSLQRLAWPAASSEQGRRWEGRHECFVPACTEFSLQVQRPRPRLCLDFCLRYFPPFRDSESCKLFGVWRTGLLCASLTDSLVVTTLRRLQLPKCGHCCHCIQCLCPDGFMHFDRICHFRCLGTGNRDK